MSGVGLSESWGDRRRLASSYIPRQGDRQTDTQTHTQTDRQTDTQTHRHTDTYNRFTEREM